MQIKRSEKKGFLGRQRYVSDISINFTDEERDSIKRNGLKNFVLYDYEKDGGPQPTSGYYGEMSLFMFLDRSVPVETSDPNLSKLIEDSIANNLKELRRQLYIQNSFDGSNTTISLDD